MEKHEQHVIPESYLKAWCDPNAPINQNYVWHFSKDDLIGRRRGPGHRSFWEPNLYTRYINGERNLLVEDNLAKLEGWFCEVRNEKINKRIHLSQADKSILCAFTAAMCGRTLANEKVWKPEFQDLNDEVQKKITGLSLASPENLEILRSPAASRNSGTPDELERLAQDPIKYLPLSFIKVFTPLFFALDLSILETETKPGFITSDNPCVRSPSFSDLLTGPDFLSPLIEIHLPISPTQCLFFNRQGRNGYVDLKKYGPIKDISIVSEVNQRTIERSDKYFIVNTNIQLLSWFITLNVLTNRTKHMI